MKQSRTAAKAPAAPQGTNPLFGLLEAARALETRLESAMAEVGLSMAKFGILRTLASRDEPVSLTDLASCQKCVRSNITQLVDRLEAEGLVKRVDDPTDRRAILAALTPLGRDRQTAGEKVLKTLTNDVSSAVSNEDRDALGRLFAALK